MNDLRLAPAAPLTRRDLIVPLLIFLAAFRLFWHSPVVNMGDSKYTLLLTQNLLRHGTFVLDPASVPHKMPITVEDTVFDGDTYQIEISDGHYYCYFPPGSSVLSAPFVLAGDALGRTVFGPDGAYSEGREAVGQHYLASLLMAALAVTFYFTARRRLPAGWSAAIALGGVLGTQVWSTASRALWGHTWGVALLGVALYLLLAWETGRRLPPVLLATVLSWTYFVRPTSSLFIVGITVYVLVYHRAVFLPYAATGAAWFAAFAAYSWTHFRRVLPHYYRASRLETTHFWEALPGNLVSPSRGVLVFVPVALFVLWLVARYWRHQPLRPLVWLTLAVSAAHVLVISCFSPWFGGWCYGPRYTTELVPWFVLLAVLGTRAALDRQADFRLPPTPLVWRGTLAAGAALLLLSVWINRRGATVIATARWNMFPVAVDDATWRVWDWRHPQFLAGLGPPPPATPAAGTPAP